MDSFTLLLIVLLVIGVTALYYRNWRYYPMGFQNPKAKTMLGRKIKQ